MSTIHDPCFASPPVLQLAFLFLLLLDSSPLVFIAIVLLACMVLFYGRHEEDKYERERERLYLLTYLGVGSFGVSAM